MKDILVIKNLLERPLGNAYAYLDENIFYVGFDLHNKTYSVLWVDDEEEISEVYLSTIDGEEYTILAAKEDLTALYNKIAVLEYSKRFDSLVITNEDRWMAELG